MDTIISAIELSILVFSHPWILGILLLPIWIIFCLLSEATKIGQSTKSDDVAILLLERFSRK